MIKLKFNIIKLTFIEFHTNRLFDKWNFIFDVNIDCIRIWRLWKEFSETDLFCIVIEIIFAFIILILNGFDCWIVTRRYLDAILERTRSTEFDVKFAQLGVFEPPVVVDSNIHHWILDDDCLLVVAIDLLGICQNFCSIPTDSKVGNVLSPKLRRWWHCCKLRHVLKSNVFRFDHSAFDERLNIPFKRWKISLSSFRVRLWCCCGCCWSCWWWSCWGAVKDLFKFLKGYFNAKKSKKYEWMSYVVVVGVVVDVVEVVVLGVVEVVVLIWMKWIKFRMFFLKTQKMRFLITQKYKFLKTQKINILTTQKFIFEKSKLFKKEIFKSSKNNFSWKLKNNFFKTQVLLSISTYVVLVVVVVVVVLVVVLGVVVVVVVVGLWVVEVGSGKGSELNISKASTLYFPFSSVYQVV